MKRNSNLTSCHSVKDISLSTKNERENNVKKQKKQHAAGLRANTHVKTKIRSSVPDELHAKTNRVGNDEN